MNLNKPCSALFLHQDKFKSLMASDPLGIERKEQKMELHTVQRTRDYCAYAN